MHEQEVKRIMNDVKNGNASIDNAIKKLKFLPFEDLGYAKIAHHRALRKGFPEVVFCQNKPVKQAVEIIKRLSKNSM